jgi:hypothetical protein
MVFCYILRDFTENFYIVLYINIDQRLSNTRILKSITPHGLSVLQK